MAKPGKAIIPIPVPTRMGGICDSSHEFMTTGWWFRTGESGREVEVCVDCGILRAVKSKSKRL